MATGYTRQSAATIVTGNTIQASDFNNEYNQLQSAFDITVGHNHDGTVGGGAPVALSTGTTGTLPLARGGTNASLTASNGGIFYSTASAGAILAGNATATKMLQSGASAAPAWSTTTWPATSTINQILYSSAANTIVGLATANSGVLITSAGGVPSIGTTLPSAVQTAITSLGTITTGTWNGTAVGATYGGTGVNNGASTITLGGSFVTSGAFATTLTVTGATNVTLPTTGTLVNTAVTSLGSLTSAATLATIGTITTGTWNGTVVVGQYGGTGVANTGKTITLGGNLTTSGAFNTTLTVTADSNVTLPTTGTLVNTAVTTLSSLVSVGTIATGVWNATIITNAKGGTGISTAASTGVAQVNAGTWSVSTALANGTTATTQTASDNSTKVATTAYVDAKSSGPTKGSAVTMNPFVSNSATTGAHGLGSTPNDMLAYLECITGELGYSTGDRVYISSNVPNAGGRIAFFSNSTTAGMSTDSVSNPVLNTKTGGSPATITSANWKLVMIPLLV